MVATRISWVSEMLAELAVVEKETAEVLGPDARFFVEVMNDWIEVTSAVHTAYPNRPDLLRVTMAGLFKEVKWLNLLFASGNYPLVLARLRYVWESVFRAWFVEAHEPDEGHPLPKPGPSADDKVDWLDRYSRKLNWPSCIEPTMKTVFPLAGQQKEVLDYYYDLWNSLNEHVHPSGTQLNRLVGESTLLVLDNFDEEWARETIAAARCVFDVIWLAVLNRYPLAFNRLSGLWGGYRVLDLVFRNAPPAA